MQSGNVDRARPRADNGPCRSRQFLLTQACNALADTATDTLAQVMPLTDPEIGEVLDIIERTIKRSRDP